MSGPTKYARLASQRSQAAKRTHQDQENRAREMDDARSAGAQERREERAAGVPPCALTPPHIADWKAAAWLAGYESETKARG